MTRCNVRQIFIGLVVLCIGILVYLIDRNPQQVYFVSRETSLFKAERLLFGSVGQHLPSFIHVFAFSMITAGIMNCRSVHCCLIVCLIWASINFAFEIGQHTEVSAVLLNHIPQWFDGVPLVEHTATYFVYGSFDALDLIWLLLGAVTAYMFMMLTVRRTYD